MPLRSIRARFWLLAGVTYLWPCTSRADETDHLTEARWKHGLAAASQGDYETARSAFRDAYERAPYPALLAALGEAELRTGHYVEAANHLADYLVASGNGSEGERERAERNLAESSRHVAAITVDTDLQGASVTVDVDPDVTTPLAHTLFMSPGEHRIRIHKDGYRERVVSFYLGAGATRAVFPSLVPTREPDFARVPVSRTAAPSLPSPPSPSGSSLKSVVVASGAVASLVAFGVGGYYALRAHSADEDAHDLRTRLTTTSCVAPRPSALDACSSLSSKISSRASSSVASNVFLLTGAALGTATLTALWGWKVNGSEVNIATGGKGLDVTWTAQF